MLALISIGGTFVPHLSITVALATKARPEGCGGVFVLMSMRGKPITAAPHQPVLFKNPERDPHRVSKAWVCLSDAPRMTRRPLTRTPAPARKAEQTRTP
jgi:hypothetical protein